MSKLYSLHPACVVVMNMMKDFFDLFSEHPVIQANTTTTTAATAFLILQASTAIQQLQQQ